MKLFIKATLLSLLASTPLLSTSASAGNGPTLYTQQASNSSVRVLVYQNGKPAAGATVKLYGNGGNLRHEFTTNNNGRVVINNLSAPGPLKLIAETRLGKSAKKEVSLYSDFEK